MPEINFFARPLRYLTLEEQIEYYNRQQKTHDDDKEHRLDIQMKNYKLNKTRAFDQKSSKKNLALLPRRRISKI